MEHVIYGVIVVVLLILLIIEMRKPKCQCRKKHGDSHCCGECGGCSHCRDYDED